MSRNFDWQTDEDSNWDDLPNEVPEQPPKRWLVRLLAIIAVAGLLVGLSVLLYQVINRRVEENTAAMRQDIVSSYNLLQIAEKEQDDELFFSLLSGRDSTWIANQHELFKRGELYNRTPFGLHALPSEPLPQQEDDTYSITFSPDLLTADVIASKPFAVEIGNGITETVVLHDIAQYRLGSERWLLSPPDSEFWGPQKTVDGSRIAISYPQRDEEVVQRLHSDLNEKIRDVCTTLAGIDCLDDLIIEVEFSIDVETLLDAPKPIAATRNERRLKTVMPAPTLVGTPIDEAGYQALYRGYASRLVTALIAQQVGYECCEQAPLFQALSDNQLSQLALKPWPVTEVAYEKILTNQVRMQDYTMMWRSEDVSDLTGPEGWRLYALIDYLLDSLPETSPAQLQRELVQRGSFMGWLNGLFAEEHNQTNSALLSLLTRGFWMRGYTQTLNVAGPGQIGPLSQDLHLHCIVSTDGLEDRQIATLYRYDAAENDWQPIYETSSFFWGSPLPGDDLFLQQEFGIDDRRWTAVIRNGEQTTELLPYQDQYVISFAQTDPNVTGLTAGVFSPDSEVATITWFDLQNCESITGCPHRELPGVPIWAPDGSRALFTANPNAQFDLLQTENRTTLFSNGADNEILPFYIANRNDLLEGTPILNAASLTQVGQGHAPFWLGDSAIGYITSSNADGPVNRQGSRVLITDVGANDTQELFKLSDLMPKIGEPVDAERLYWINYLMVDPTNSEQLYVVVLTVIDQQAYLLSYNRSSEEIELLLSSGWLANHSLGISPDGRYLVLTGMVDDTFQGGEETALLQVYDQAQRETIPFLSLATEFPPFSTYDWSLDGKWLAMLLDDNIVGIFAPGSRQIKIVETPRGECGSPAWLNSG